MKQANCDPLLNELLADESLEVVRRRSLEQGLAVARRRRQRAGWAKAGMIAAVILGALCLFLPNGKRPELREQVARGPATTTHAPSAVRFISDDELLALFSGRPLALIGPPERRTLLFLDQPTTQMPDNGQQNP
ncbi:MAG: hypothetical protein HZA90_17315 [Verrucomicrobia bacterium]|nr:hypothetical protein [Verrucomicrobiota bacterium]